MSFKVIKNFFARREIDTKDIIGHYELSPVCRSFMDS